MTLYKEKLRRRGQKVKETKLLWKFSPNDIILGIITETEKARLFAWTDPMGRKIWDKEQVYKYIFKVAKWANKNDIKKAIEIIYGKEVAKVNIIKIPKKTRFRRGLVRRDYVKAIVTLKNNEKLDIIK